MTLVAGLAPVGAAEAAAPSAKASIAGGYFPHPTQWPWTTALIDFDRTAVNGDYGRQFCTGVLISSTRVLTAAHCVDAAQSEGQVAQDPSGIQALVGRRNLTLTNEGVRANVTGIAIHPKAYLPDTGPHTNHAFYDIAVLFLDRVVALPPAVIGRPDDWARSATVMGFGHWNYDHANPLTDEYLRAADFDTLTDAQCAAAVNYGHSGQHYFPSIHVCANNAAGSQVDCVTHGDSGGPMMINTAGGWRLVGITSFYPQVYRDRCGAGGPFGFAWVAGTEMRDWPLAVAHPVAPNTGQVEPAINQRMTLAQARRYTREMIRDKTNGRVRGLRPRCRRDASSSFACTLRWRIGRRVYSGRAAFWHYVEDGDQYWTYAFTGRHRPAGCERCRGVRLTW